jgi:hypothetical protein
MLSRPRLVDVGVVGATYKQRISPLTFRFARSGPIEITTLFMLRSRSSDAGAELG